MFAENPHLEHGLIGFLQDFTFRNADETSQRIARGQRCLLYWLPKNAFESGRMGSRSLCKLCTHQDQASGMTTAKGSCFVHPPFSKLCDLRSGRYDQQVQWGFSCLAAFPGRSSCQNALHPWMVQDPQAASSCKHRDLVHLPLLCSHGQGR